MESIDYAKCLLDDFERTFPEKWLTLYDWNNNDSSKENVARCVYKIELFQNKMFLGFSKMVLSADFLAFDSDECLKSLAERTLEETIPSDIRALDSIIDRYKDLLSDLAESVAMVRSHIYHVKERFNPQRQDEVVSAFSFNRIRPNRDTLVELLELVCEVCLSEYRLSYNESFIRGLIMRRQMLSDRSFSNKEVQNIIEVAITKIELMLFKLQIFSKDKKISYNYNAQHVDLEPLKHESGPIAEFKDNFLDFVDPQRIDELRSVQISEGLDGDSVDMWRFVLLMRYYTKGPHKNDDRINNLLNLAELHYKQSLLSDFNIVDKYADLTFINYMYNCRFSYFCSKESKYAFEDMKLDLNEIEQLQKNTAIYNYHPFQKAFVYTYNLLKQDIANLCDSEVIKRHIHFLEYCYDQLKKNVAWCKKYQPYLLQLRFNYSVVKDTNRNLKFFCPSSFMRPIRFDHLDDVLFDYKTKVAALHGRIELLEDKRQLKEIENKIKEVETRSFERMAFFSTVVIFLVGLISIFTGNNHSVSLVDKMEYVSALGIILLLFLCLSYFITAKLSSRFKSSLFGILLLFFLGYLLYMAVELSKV